MIKRPTLFYNLNKFVVQPEKASSKARNVWNILTPGGAKLGTAAYVPENIFVRIFRALGIKASYAATISVCDAEGTPIITIVKPFSFGLFTAKVKDVEGVVGYIKEIKQGLDGRRYVFYNVHGDELGSLDGDWRTGRLQIKEPNVASMGLVKRKSDELNPVIFDEKSGYYLVDLYINPKNSRWRRMLMCTCATIDILLR